MMDAHLEQGAADHCGTSTGSPRMAIVGHENLDAIALSDLIVLIVSTPPHIRL